MSSAGRQPDLSAVLVSHHSAAELAICLPELRAAAQEAGLQLELVVVEQSEDAQEVARIESLGPDRLLVAPNRGFAAGLNRGVEVSRGEVIALGNPDLGFAPDSLASMMEALAAGWDVVGPQLTLGQVLMPPAESQTVVAELGRQRARRTRRATHRYLRRYLQQCDRLWAASEPVAVDTLSGAFLMTHRQVLERIGPWDEEYFLYFEETDWLRRVRRAGYRLAQVPTARVEHRWGHSARPAAQGRQYESSRQRYYRRWSRMLGPWLTSRRTPRPPCPEPWPLEGTSATEATAAARWLVTASPWGFPAGLLPSTPEGPVAASRSFVEGMPLDSACLLLRWADGEVLGPWVRPLDAAPSSTAS